MRVVTFLKAASATPPPCPAGGEAGGGVSICRAFSAASIRRVGGCGMSPVAGISSLRAIGHYLLGQLFKVGYAPSAPCLAGIPLVVIEDGKPIGPSLLEGGRPVDLRLERRVSELGQFCLEPSVHRLVAVVVDRRQLLVKSGWVDFRAVLD